VISRRHLGGRAPLVGGWCRSQPEALRPKVYQHFFCRGFESAAFSLMNPADAGKVGPPGPDPNGAVPPGGNKQFQSPYIALYPSSSLLNWNGAIPNAATDSTRQIQYSGIPQFNAQTAGIPVLQSFPSGLVGFGNQQQARLPTLTPNANDRRKTNRTPVACVVCHKAKSTCDRSRPCARCRRLGKSHLCKDRPHRKKGRPRKRLLNNTENSTQGSQDKAQDKKARTPAAAATSSSDAKSSESSFKLSDCYLGGDMPRFMANMSKKPAVKSSSLGGVKSESMDGSIQGGQSSGSRSLNGLDGSSLLSKSSKGIETPLTELQTSFANMAHSVNETLWEEVIGDMSSFIHDAKKYERKYTELFRKMPDVKRIMNPLFCMYLTHMSYYLHPDQFIQLQKRMASSGVLIPNGSSCKIRKFDESLIKTVDCKAIAPISRLRWCLKHPRPHMESRFSRIDNWPLATIKVNMFSTPDPLTLLVYVSVNEEFERIFGFRQAEMVLMSRRPFYYRLIHPKDWKKQLSLEMSTLLNQRKRFNTLIRCVCKWKEEIVCLETFRYSFDEEDTLNHFTISFTPLPRYMFK